MDPKCSKADLGLLVVRFSYGRNEEEDWISVKIFCDSLGLGSTFGHPIL
jgi:hypothetical protein